MALEVIASGSPLGSPTNDTFPSAANGHADEEDVVIPAKPSSNEKGYDKKSSFFDNISSDLKDRTEQQQTSEFVDGRAMRREERSKNMETFGQGSVDGGFRGRGRGRGRGFGGRGRGYYGGGRGGFENGDRGGFRGRGRGQNTESAV
jgi:protein LSM14